MSVVLADDMKSPAMEKLELVRKWSINTYKVRKKCHSCYHAKLKQMQCFWVVDWRGIGIKF